MSLKKIYFLSILGGLLIGLLVIAAVKYFPKSDSKQSTSVTRLGWVKVAPPTRLFTASFPVSPERTEAELPIPGTNYSLIQESHIATDGKGNVYQIFTFVYPKPFNEGEASAVLDTALQGMVAVAPGNKLLESTTAKFNELPAKLFMIQDRNSRYYQGELFLKGRVLYQAFITYDGGDLAEEDLKYFLDSITPTVDMKAAL